jgi:hypothetical protein
MARHGVSGQTGRSGRTKLAVGAPKTLRIARRGDVAPNERPMLIRFQVELQPAGKALRVAIGAPVFAG